jgi:hypothetical protein
MFILIECKGRVWKGEKHNMKRQSERERERTINLQKI